MQAVTIKQTASVPIISTITGEATKIKSESAALNGSLTNNFNNVEYGFYWGTTNTPNTKVVVGKTGSDSLNFSLNMDFHDAARA
jgi:hypothetical protein